ncbi:MAG: pyrroline-5-carboxylate reductase, partial [Gammaproteobacteria bacterium]|nr:pyrroline-5-carboxylate reductase [Gammaproteobacteria bacterium]
MSMDSIAFIGGGNMATSMVGGLIAKGHPGDAIWVTDVDETRLAALQDRFGVRTSKENGPAAARAKTVVLAVKPQVMSDVVAELAPTLREHAPLVISIAAGVREPDIRRWLGHEAAIVRCMPNTPALLGVGASALYANPFVSAVQRSSAQRVLSAAGTTVWVEQEDLLDAVTAVSGSGPAYFF